MQEVWKPVVGYEGLYEVSDLGRVRSLPRKWVCGNGGVKYHDGKILKPHNNKCGYLIVSLYKNGEKKIKIHKLVAEAFLNHKSDISNRLVIDHINNDKKDNRLSNLQIITNRENCSKDKKNKTSKYTGVCWARTYNKWQVQIRHNKKSIYIGRYDCEIEAKNAYISKLNEINSNQ